MTGVLGRARLAAQPIGAGSRTVDRVGRFWLPCRRRVPQATARGRGGSCRTGSLAGSSSCRMGAVASRARGAGLVRGTVSGWSLPACGPLSACRTCVRPRRKHRLRRRLERLALADLTSRSRRLRRPPRVGAAARRSPSPSPGASPWGQGHRRPFALGRDGLSGMLRVRSKSSFLVRAVAGENCCSGAPILAGLARLAAASASAPPPLRPVAFALRAVGAGSVGR